MVLWIVFVLCLVRVGLFLMYGVVLNVFIWGRCSSIVYWLCCLIRVLIVDFFSLMIKFFFNVWVWFDWLCL